MLGFAAILKNIATLFIAFVIQTSMAGAVDETPKQAAEEFMDGITTRNVEVMDMYMDNQYVNFIDNVVMSEKNGRRFRESLLGNLEYEIVDMREREALAVVKVLVKGNDFSKVMDRYDKASYEYVTENLYDDAVVDKKALRKKCLSIYVDQVEKVARKGKIKERTVYLPMKQDRNGVWRVLLTDEIMEQLLGNLALPDGVIEKDGAKKDEGKKKKEN